MIILLPYNSFIDLDLMLKLGLLSLALFIALTSCGTIFQKEPQCKPHPKADIIYFNGDIITMNDKQR